MVLAQQPHRRPRFFVALPLSFIAFRLFQFNLNQSESAKKLKKQQTRTKCFTDERLLVIFSLSSLLIRSCIFSSRPPSPAARPPMALPLPP